MKQIFMFSLQDFTPDQNLTIALVSSNGTTTRFIEVCKLAHYIISFS